jgi:uncharacterized protein (UPF0297 family)
MLSEIETEKKVVKAQLDCVKDVVDRVVKALDQISFGVVNAFVVYDKSGRPLAYYFRTDGEEISDEEMKAIMKLHPEATDNAETYIEWRETA